MFTSTALGQSAAPELRGQRTLPALPALTGPWGEHCKSDRHFCFLGDGRLVGWSLLEIQIRRGETSRVALREQPHPKPRRNPDRGEVAARLSLSAVNPDATLTVPVPEYHRRPAKPHLNTTGKISVTPTKPLSNQRDLSLAYSPGVAYACLAIQEDPTLAAEYTSRGNLVAVVTNGTAVLGLGDIGPLAGKPVMEGKGCLFKKFAGIDVFDIELAEHDPDKLVEIIAALEPTLGGINLEDIKAPECFYIEKEAARAHEHSRLPRRPARHGHHQFGRAAQRAGTGGQEDR
jgi:hypothetical protein